jgi:PST family polysaccharide transporter
MSTREHENAERSPESHEGQTATSETAGEGKGKRGKKGGKRYGQVTKQGVVWSYFREGVSELITTPTAIIMARLISPFDFGIAASAGFFLTLATRLTNFGFNQALVRVKELRPEHSSSVFVISLGMGVCAYAILAGSAGLMAAFFRAPQIAEVMPIAALTFLISPFGTVPAALMTRNMEFKRTATADWIAGFGEAIASVWMAWTGFGFWSIIYGRVIGDLLNTGAKVALGGWRVSFRFSMAATRELFSFGSGVFVKRLLDYTANSLDNLVVGRILGVTALGFYDKAFTTMSKVLVRINRGGPMVSFRVFSAIYEDAERFRAAYRKVVLATTLLSYPILAGLAAAGPELIVVMYGERWFAAVPAFQLLCIAGTLKITNEYAGMAAQATGRVWNQVWRQATYALLIALFAGVGSYAGGITGAAAGVLVATACMTALMNTLLVRMTALSTRVLLESQIPGLAAAVLVAAAVSLVRFGLAGVLPAWQLLIVESMTGAATYALYLKLNTFREVRQLIRDTAEDLAPPLGRVVRLIA